MPHLNPSHAGRWPSIWFAYDGGMEGWVDLGVGYIPRRFTCPQTITHRSSHHVIWPGVKLTSFWSWVQHPNCYATMPPIINYTYYQPHVHLLSTLTIPHCHSEWHTMCINHIINKLISTILPVHLIYYSSPLHNQYIHQYLQFKMPQDGVIGVWLRQLNIRILTWIRTFTLDLK